MMTNARWSALKLASLTEDIPWAAAWWPTRPCTTMPVTHTGTLLQGRKICDFIVFTTIVPLRHDSCPGTHAPDQRQGAVVPGADAPLSQRSRRGLSPRHSTPTAQSQVFHRTEDARVSRVVLDAVRLEDD